MPPRAGSHRGDRRPPGAEANSAVTWVSMRKRMIHVPRMEMRPRKVGRQGRHHRGVSEQACNTEGRKGEAEELVAGLRFVLRATGSHSGHLDEAANLHLGSFLWPLWAEWVGEVKSGSWDTTLRPWQSSGLR